MQGFVVSYYQQGNAQQYHQVGFSNFLVPLQVKFATNAMKLLGTIGVYCGHESAN